MRFRTFILLVFWIVVLGYAGYGLFSAASVYFQMRSVVDQAFQDATSRQLRGGAMPESVTPEYLTDVRAGILMGAQRAGLPLDPRNLNVASERSAIRVTLHWSQAVVSYGGEAILAVPLWIDNSYDIRTPRRAG